MICPLRKRRLLSPGNRNARPDLTPKAARQALECGELKPLARRFNAYSLYLLTGFLNRFRHQRYEWPV